MNRDMRQSSLDELAKKLCWVHLGDFAYERGCYMRQKNIFVVRSNWNIMVKGM